MKRVVIGGLAAVVLAAAVGCGGASSSTTTTFDKRGSTGDPNQQRGKTDTGTAATPSK